MAAPSTPSISTNPLNTVPSNPKTAKSNSKLSKVVDFLNRVRELIYAFLNHPITKALLHTFLVVGLVAVTVLQLFSPVALAAFVALAAAAGVALNIHSFFNKVVDGIKPDESKDNNSEPNQEENQFYKQQTVLLTQYIEALIQTTKDHTRLIEKLFSQDKTVPANA